ncbi:hypothetical protein HPB50_025341 [Hyalomma asiaticum]|uniref:Uncharacterized protein n=1 Tax=Hyalomma asiaticum TaxID=266040 RepID=A0ACB7RZ01_HYAAI|nr:hypothetical protein HPB50_025341 [Hyalomma asiaticum]
MFKQPPRLERLGNDFRVTWTLPEAQQQGMFAVPLVYTLQERHSHGGTKWEEIGQTQQFSATVSGNSTTKPWEIRVVAVSANGIWAVSALTQVPSSRTARGGDTTATMEPRKSELAAESRVLGPWQPPQPPPQLLSLRPSTARGLEAHISWQSNQDLEAGPGDKYEVIIYLVSV